MSKKQKKYLDQIEAFFTPSWKKGFLVVLFFLMLVLLQLQYVALYGFLYTELLMGYSSMIHGYAEACDEGLDCSLVNETASQLSGGWFSATEILLDFGNSLQPAHQILTLNIDFAPVFSIPYESEYTYTSYPTIPNTIAIFLYWYVLSCLIVFICETAKKRLR